MVDSNSRKWFALGLLSAVQFMVVLDMAIVNVALPSIHGGALGIAALSTIANSRTEDALAGGASHADALVAGFHGAFLVSVIVAVIGVIASFFLIRRDELEQQVEQVAEPEMAFDLAA